MDKKEPVSEKEVIKKVVMGGGKKMPNENLVEKDKTSDDKKAEKPKKKRSGIIIFVIGVLALIGGLTFMLISLFAEPGLRDAEYLVEIGTWIKEGEPNIIWQFTEIGKGTLTTNNHTNDYDFIWAIDGDKIKIETEWLYTLEDEYTYELDQQENKLILGEDAIFVPVTE